MFAERIGIVHKPVELFSPQLFSPVIQVLIILGEIERVVFIQVQRGRQETIAFRICLLEFVVLLESHETFPVIVMPNIAAHNLRAQTFRNEIQVEIERNDPIHIAPTSLQITVANNLVYRIPSLP